MTPEHEEWNSTAIAREFASQQRQIDGLWRAINGLPREVSTLTGAVERVAMGQQRCENDVRAVRETIEKEESKGQISRRFLIQTVVALAAVIVASAGVVVGVLS